jgi:hypothetical protein
MLKNPYLTFFSLNIPTIFRENPHWGADGVPFINNITGAALTSLPSRSVKSLASDSWSTGAGTGAGAALGWGAGSCEAGTWRLRASVREGGLAPEMRARILESLTRTKKGTAATSNVSAISGSASASSWKKKLALEIKTIWGFVYLCKADRGICRRKFGEDFVHLLAWSGPWSPEVEGDYFRRTDGFDEFLELLNGFDFMDGWRRIHVISEKFARSVMSYKSEIFQVLGVKTRDPSIHSF